MKKINFLKIFMLSICIKAHAMDVNLQVYNTTPKTVYVFLPTSTCFSGFVWNKFSIPPSTSEEFITSIGNSYSPTSRYTPTFFWGLFFSTQSDGCSFEKDSKPVCSGQPSGCYGMVWPLKNAWDNFLNNQIDPWGNVVPNKLSWNVGFSYSVNGNLIADFFWSLQQYNSNFTGLYKISGCDDSNFQAVSNNTSDFCGMMSAGGG